MRQEHCTSDELQELLDGRLPGPEANAVRRHVAGCAHCRSRHDALGALDRTLRALPVAEVRRGFTEEVLHRAGIMQAGGRTYRMLEGVAYLVGLGLVLAAMAAVFVATGTFTDMQQGQEGGAAVSGAWEALLGTIGAWNAQLASWLGGFMPYLNTAPGTGVIAASLLVVAALAGLDRLMHRRLIERVRP